MTHTVGHFRDRSFQAISCTGTDKLTTDNSKYTKQESRAVAGKPRDAAVNLDQYRENRLPKLVRQRIPDRRTSEGKRPRAVCVESTARSTYLLSYSLSTGAQRSANVLYRVVCSRDENADLSTKSACCCCCCLVARVQTLVTTDNHRCCMNCAGRPRSQTAALNAFQPSTPSPCSSITHARLVPVLLAVWHNALVSI